MKLWILSNLHADSWTEDLAANPPNFDVFVCAGDVVTENIERSIEMMAAIARGKPAVFVAGNHEWEGAPLEVVAWNGRRAAERYNVHRLENLSVEIDGVRFAGATLWGERHSQYFGTIAFLQSIGADVIVTYFSPAAQTVHRALAAGGMWIYGHHHGHSDRTIATRRLIRNAVGYPGEVIDRGPARPDYVVELES